MLKGQWVTRNQACFAVDALVGKSRIWLFLCVWAERSGYYCCLPQLWGSLKATLAQLSAGTATSWFLGLVSSGKVVSVTTTASVLSAAWELLVWPRVGWQTHDCTSAVNLAQSKNQALLYALLIPNLLVQVWGHPRALPGHYVLLPPMAALDKSVHEPAPQTHHGLSTVRRISIKN